MKFYWIVFCMLYQLLITEILSDRNSSNTQLSLTQSDTKTKCLINTFSNNEIRGFGINDKPADINTKQPFFISLKLPYSIKLGEIIIISAKIFNNLNQSVNSDVTLFNDAKEFKFIDDTEKNNDLNQIKNINISMNSHEVVKFIIKPLKLGAIKLQLRANNSLYSDVVLHELKVEAGGLRQKHNQDFLLEVAKNETYSSKFSIHIPASAVDNSQYITLKVSGDYLRPTIENLNKLIEMPTGCGEQNMINFVPSVLILQLLKATGKYLQEKELVSKVETYIKIGYQQQLAYRHKSGGFSAFGNSTNEEENIWLTAYVLRFFIKASKFTSIIDTSIIETGLEYLAQQQLQDGSFPYTGYLFMPALENKLALTSFVILTFVESRKYSQKYPGIIKKSVEFLNANVDNTHDIYALALTATALKCTGSYKFIPVIERLINLSEQGDQDPMSWSANDGSIEKDVEITAYVLLAFLGGPIYNKPILKWLIAQRNEHGGFKSTQDTVVGLLALVKVAERLHNEVNSTFTYTALDQEGKEIYQGEFIIDTDNVNDLQKQKLPSSTRFIQFTLKGIGYTFAQLSSQYNIASDAQYNYEFRERKNLVKHFVIETDVNILNTNLLNLEICFTYQPLINQYFNRTNMVIMEINLPTGFQFNVSSCMNPKDYEIIKRIESKNYNTIVILYFEYLKVNSRQCAKIDVEKTNEVMELQPGVIKMYDYYNTSRSDTLFYSLNTEKF